KPSKAQGVVVRPAATSQPHCVQLRPPERGPLLPNSSAKGRESLRGDLVQVAGRVQRSEWPRQNYPQRGTLELYAEVFARRLRRTEQPCRLMPCTPAPLQFGKGGPSSANGKISLIGNCAKRAPRGEMAARAAASNCPLSILTF